MDYLRILKEQSAYIDHGIEELIKELSALSNNSHKSDTNSLQQYYAQIENIHEEMQMLLETTLMNVVRQQKLQVNRKAIISEVSRAIENIEETFGTAISPNNDNFLNEIVQENGSLEDGTSKNESEHLQESYDDDEDIAALLCKSFPKL